jgi:hypothetical protein
MLETRATRKIQTLSRLDHHVCRLAAETLTHEE